MHRVLWCECGQKMRITPEMLGASGKCVKCGSEVVATEMNTTLVGDEGDQMPSSSPPPPPPPSFDRAPAAGMAPPPPPPRSPVRKTPMMGVIAIGGVVAVLVLVLACYLLFGRGGDPLAPNDKNFARTINAILAKDPEFFQEQINDKVRNELVNMGMVLAIKKGYGVMYEVGEDKQGLLIVDQSNRNAISLKCATSDDNVKVVRFTLPPKGESAVAYEVIYTFQWKPTPLLTDAKYKAVQDALGTRVDKIREEIKKTNSRSIVLVRYNDGWHKAEQQQ
jgi:hypothetical protein